MCVGGGVEPHRCSCLDTDDSLCVNFDKTEKRVETSSMVVALQKSRTLILWKHHCNPISNLYSFQRGKCEAVVIAIHSESVIERYNIAIIIKHSPKLKRALFSLKIF